MTLAVPMLGNRDRPGGWEGQGHLPPTLQDALVCEVATCPASLLPVSPLFGLSACLAACSVGRSPLPGLVPPGAALSMGLSRNRPSTGSGAEMQGREGTGYARGKRRSCEGPLF